jgi:hypothetical protein
VRILEEAKGRVGGANGAAARLGLKRTTLIARMKKLGIDGRQVLDANRYCGVEVSLPEVAAASRGEFHPIICYSFTEYKLQSRHKSI